MAIAKVIKFEGPQDALVWKFPYEDFNATSQLIVDETYEALLVVNGNAADLFTAGRRTLSVPNIPIAENSRKFMLKIVGFRDQFSSDDLISKFRGIISSQVKDCISKIMINGMLSYFMMNAHLFELSSVIKERLRSCFARHCRE